MTKPAPQLRVDVVEGGGKPRRHRERCEIGHHLRFDASRLASKWRQCGVCAACMLRRMSVHAARAKEPKTTYVWEDLNVGRYEDGAARTFRKRQPKGAIHEYAIAGTLHLEHLARLGRRLDENASELDLDIFRLAEALGSSDLTEERIRTRLLRMLKAHEQEWNAFLDDLGPNSFVTRWATRFR